jgi:hypothetical protein
MQCQKCHRELAANQPVYRVAVGYSVNDYDLFGSAVGSICAGCAFATRTTTFQGREYVHSVYGNQQWRTPEPCAVCSRAVVLNGRRRRPKYVACGNRCRASVYARQRRPRRKARPEKNCATCGERFVPARSRGIYCSAACRQKAYRRRIAATLEA